MSGPGAGQCGSVPGAGLARTPPCPAFAMPGLRHARRRPEPAFVPHLVYRGATIDEKTVCCGYHPQQRSFCVYGPHAALLKP